MREDIELTSFTKGEVSPRLKGRTDFKGYFDACDTMLNMVVLPQGGATRRPGTLFSALAADQNGTNNVRLIEFQFSTLQNYILEFSNFYMQVYKDGFPVTNVLTVTGAVNNGSGAVRIGVASAVGLYPGNSVTLVNVGGVPGANGTFIVGAVGVGVFDLVGSTFSGAYTSGGTATVIVGMPTPWTQAQVPQLGHTQTQDVLIVTHPNVTPRQITRSSHTNWVISNFGFLDGPFFPPVVGNTITPSATTGAITLTLASGNGVNNGSGWLTTDVGRHVRVGTPFGWATITGFVSNLVVNAIVQGAVSNGDLGALPAGPTGTFQLGKWSDSTGYPWLVQFWQQRVFFIGSFIEPNAVEGSAAGRDYLNFALSNSAGTVVDANAVSWVIADDQVNAARWVAGAGSAQTPQLAIGTDGAEHILQAGGAAVAMTPTSIQVYRETTLGGRAYSRAIRATKSLLFAGFHGRKLYNYTFNWQVNGYEGPDMTVASEHLTRGLIADICYQQTPYGVVWCRLADGSLIGLTYLPEQGIMGWHRHQLGGNYYGGPPIVESIACIPSADLTYDQLWLVVKRTINGVVVRTVETMTKYYDADPQETAVYEDLSIQSALTYPADTITASAMTGSATFTTFAPQFSTVGSIIRMSGGIAIITSIVGAPPSNQAVGTWIRSPTNLVPVLGTGSSGWSLNAPLSTYSGLSVLEGQTVQLYGDGADLGTVTVTGGAVTIPASNGKATFLTAGLPIFYRLVTMPWAVQQGASAQGKTKTISTLYLRFMETLGCNVGRRITDPMTQLQTYVTEALQTRSAGDFMGSPPPLFTGLYKLPLQGSHDMEGQIDIEGQGPYPLTVLALIGTSDVGDLPGPG